MLQGIVGDEENLIIGNFKSILCISLSLFIHNSCYVLVNMHNVTAGSSSSGGRITSVTSLGQLLLV